MSEGDVIGEDEREKDSAVSDTVDGELALVPLAARTIAVTAARRADEQRVLLERRGAIVRAAPAIRMIPIVEDTVVRSATERILAAPADLMVLTTATGVRWWQQVCEEWGLAEDLSSLMEKVPLYSRGPKVTGALRAAGLREHAAAVSETSAELLEMLVAEGVAGKTVAVQLQGASTDWNPMAPLVDGLRKAGAEVVEVPLYRWELCENVSEFDELVRTIAGRRVDAVTFTSAPAVVAMLDRAEALSIYDDLVDALSGPVVAFCVGPVTAAPLVELGVQTSEPARMRLGSLMRHVTDELAESSNEMVAAGHRLSVFAAAALVDDVVVQLSPSPMALLQALSEDPGACVSREKLLDALPGEGEDTHAVETAIGRLRKAIGAPLVQTVVKRGYRLAVDRARK